MFRLLRHPHLVEAVRWSPEPVGWRGVLVGVLGVGAPVLAGLAFGQARLGFGIGLGALLLGGGAGEVAGWAETAGPAALAVPCAALIAGRPWGDPALVALASVVAVLGGYSRPAAGMSVRFAIYLVLAVIVIEAAPDRIAASVAFAIGAGWNMLLRRLDGRVASASAAPPLPPHARRLRVFRKRLRHLPAWQYPIRLGGGLAVAAVLRRLWTGHHGGWLLITVALLTGRVLERLPVRVTQRAFGVVAGVVATWLVFLLARGPVATAGVIAALAAVIPLLRAGNYLLYSAAMTPMIILTLDYGRPHDAGLLIDRLAATFGATATVLVLNVALELAFGPPPAPARRVSVP